jgi:hypothetical protein
MNEKELLAIIGQYEKSALGSSVSVGPSVGGNITPAGQNMTTLEIDRYNALNAYFGRPMGNEIDNRSQVVLPELRDTVEWVMPQLMRMFAATQKVFQFDPVKPGDEDQADLETQAVNAVFMQQNNGFFILHDFFKDALLLRNGYVKVYYEKKKESTTESYTGLTEDEVTQLLNPPENDEGEPDEIEVLEQTEIQSPLGPMFNLKIKRISEVGVVKVECTPPEEILVSPQARHKLDDCPFAEHKTQLSRSELIKMGFDANTVNAITMAHPNWLNLIALARDEVVDQLSEESPADVASELVDFREVHIRVDYDGDGIAELRKVFIGGEKILTNEECAEMNLAYCSPIRMPHRHVGISYYDLLNDLQVIKTTLFRQALDNIYQTNNQRTAVNVLNDAVNIDDMMTNRPGGLIRVKGIPGENIMQMGTIPGMMQQVLPALDYVDSLREMRTGIGKDTMGVDADALQDVTKGGQLAAMSAAAMKVELVARLLAEGVKDIALKIHSVMIRHQNKPMTLQIAGKWIDVNPSEWKQRTSVTVNVGLGSGNRQEAQGHLMLLAQMQSALKDFGLVGPSQAFETFKEGTRLLGFENPERFAMDPNSQEYQQWMAQHPPQQPPQMAVAQLKAQTDMQVEQMRSKNDQAKIQGQQALEAMKIHGDMAQAQMSEHTDRIKAQGELAHAAVSGEHDRQVDMAQMESQFAQTLIKVIGQIVASQLKQDPGVNAGQTLSADYRSFNG